MSKRDTERRPDTASEHSDYQVGYATSRAAVRSAVAERCGVVLVDGGLVRESPAVLRWLVTMAPRTVVGVVGGVPEPMAAFADVSVDRPVTEAAVEALVRRRHRRANYADAVERYYRAVADGADERTVDAARTATEECGATLDAADRRSVLDATGG